MQELENEILIQSAQSIEPPVYIEENAYLGAADYESLYALSIKDPEAFWGRIAEQELDWFRRWDNVFEWNYPAYKWFKGARLNITYNCLDRHVKNGLADKVAYTYCNESGAEEVITYGELLDKVSRFAAGLQKLGIHKGDRVAIYMPLCIEQIVAILGCARIGAVHSVVYAGFSANALRVRIEDAQAKLVIASTSTTRRNKVIDLKSIAAEAVKGLDCVNFLMMHRRNKSGKTGKGVIDFHDFLDKQEEHCDAEPMDAEDPLFILYTSGTTGKPKGVLHTTAGYSLFTHYTAKVTFDLKDDDVFWCTADTGWVTGHSYIIYGPLSNGVSGVIYEGAPDHPDAGIWWSMVEKYRVTKFYTAPTAVRLFMKYGDEWPAAYDLSSLKIIGSVGEPINPEAWLWYHTHIGRKNCAVVDTWWQTETGGHMISTIPAMLQKPGRAGLPFLGIEAEVVNRKGAPVPPDTVGVLVIKKPWPGALRTCYGEPERFAKYWNEIDGFYFAGDLATKDAEGYIMILGRADDVLNVSGHRIGTAEVESALVSHPAVAEAAVIGKPHEIKGQSIKAFIILRQGAGVSDALIKEIQKHVAHELGKLGSPDEIDIVERLPKTRSGKIMRRVLKAKELGQDSGDVSTLED